MTAHLLMCLVCRGRGHTVAGCRAVLDRTLSAEELKSMRSQDRVQVRWAEIQGTVCQTCEALDLIRFFQTPPPWKAQTEFTDNFKEEKQHIRSLGNVGSARFWADCPLCCSIFSITPLPTHLEQEIYLVPEWTISRLSGELGVVTMDTAEKQRYATCLLVVLEPSFASLPIRITAHRGDALCLIEEDIYPERVLGGKYIITSDVNTDLIHSWIERCQVRHDESCLPVATDALSAVRLLDVNTRQIIRYPGDNCEYIALSYVWGKVSRDRFRLGDTVGTVASTLEDAIILTKKLGKNYIWVDSICIDQDDEGDVLDQVDRMWSIYRGAWITIIAVSGSSADAGLPRLSRKQTQPQVQCIYRGKAIVSLMPTLSMQIWSSPWGQRAWTLQEGLLSARCLYLTDHQMYFDCASMQCSESLEESRSWAHNLTPTSNPTEEGFMTWMLRQAGAGALRIPLDWPPRRLEHWGEKLNLYSYRQMTFPLDAIRAFSGVLQRLETIYPKGFFWGLPYEDFDWALTWGAQATVIRREGFPSWSWAGWRGAVFFGQPLDVRQTRRIPTCLSIECCKAGQVKDVFVCEPSQVTRYDGPNILILHDPVHAAWDKEPREGRLNLSVFPAAEKNGLLFITAVCFHFVPNFSHPQTKTYTQGRLQRFTFEVKKVLCLIKIYSMDSNIPGKWVDGMWVLEDIQTKHTFVLLARDYVQDFILHKLMWVRWVEQGIAERKTVLELLVPLDNLGVLEEFAPRKQRFVLK